MAQEATMSGEQGWIEASGLPYLLRTLRIALHPAKLGLALVALLLTFGWGWLLDAVWIGGGVGESAITDYIVNRRLHMPYAEPDGELGIFRVFHEYERGAILGFIASSVPFVGGGNPLDHLAAGAYGLAWMVRHHPVYFVLFGSGSLLIWSLFGGAICRLAALHFAREEKLTHKDGLSFSRQKLFDGFFLAPCIPLIFIFIIALVMMLGGMFLRVPGIGDVVGGVFFFLAIIGGLLLALLLVGCFVGGGLFWPAVAADGSDAFDAFSRGISYPFTRPLKMLVYSVIAIVIGAVCWLVLNWFVHMALALTRAIVGYGTTWFGWWMRGEGEAANRKLDVLWPVNGLSGPVWVSPDWSNLAWYEYVSAAMIALYVLLTVALLWSFLCTFYFSASTIIYFLLRRDVDLIDLEDVYTESVELQGPAAASSVTAET
jgi:hypothetical protein